MSHSGWRVAAFYYPERASDEHHQITAGSQKNERSGEGDSSDPYPPH
jgi:hypothetical protein